VKVEAKADTGRDLRTAEGARPKLDLQAAILAGGFGTRMRPLTETIPKVMIEVCGKPFLYHQLELVRENGMARVLLLVAHLGEKIEQHFGDGASLGLELSYPYEPAPLGTGGALKHAAGQLEDEFLVLESLGTKPAPEIFLQAAAKLGVSPGQALVIEDSLAGIEAARAAGMKCVAYVPSARLAEFADADCLISDFPQPAVEFFQRLMAAEAAPHRSRAAQTVLPLEGA
jgi:mannose-1-phosphate guanylyltransferase